MYMLVTTSAKSWFHFLLTDNCEYFCLCGKVAYEWCSRCNVQGYCGEKCRAQDEGDHAKICSKSKAKAMQSVRTRRVSRESKF